jgi:hypothetical protein
MNFSANNKTIDQLLGYIKNKELAIPEIQRPFVWDNSKVRDLIDSLYRGYPIGYIILWNNPNIRAKDGTLSGGKKIIIDGQQRLTALTASILGYEVIDSNYKKKRIKIAFNPIDNGGKFEVQTPVHLKDKKWIDDITRIFSNDFDSFNFVNDYCESIPEISRRELNNIIIKLKNILNVQVGTIDLDQRIDIETVTDIFIRINSQGKILSQADFAMSKIAADEKYGGNLLRKVIDYFCHLSVAPHYYVYIYNNDQEFVESEYATKIAWLKDDRENVFDPDYNDVLRVSFMYKFGRAKISDLVSLLSGRNFETREFEEEIAKESFSTLKSGVLAFINKHNFEQFLLAIKSVGYVSPKLIASSAAINFAYQLYLTLNATDMNKAEVKKLVQKWFILSNLTQRYSNSPETQMDRDLRSIKEKGFQMFFHEIEAAELSDVFWEIGLLQMLETSSVTNPGYKVFLAAQVFLNDVSFLSNSSKVSDLILSVGDIHHIFPKSYLKRNGSTNKGEYNQIANLTYLDTQVNISIGDKAPNQYLMDAFIQCQTKSIKVGNIIDEDSLKDNLSANCIPENTKNYTYPDYDTFLKERRSLMAQKIKRYYKSI